MRPLRTLVFTALALAVASASQATVRVKDLTRLSSARENALVGYGIVTGLAGTGDTARSFGTLQSISNVLRRFGIDVAPEQLRSRNVAGVMVTTNMPAFARSGDRLSVNVTSLGDARSLLGGTLMLTHLNGPDGELYALAQGPLSVGGFKFDLNGNIVQKNHPTSANIPGGATIERSLETPLVDPDGSVEYVLNDPDLTTASRIADALNRSLGNRPDRLAAVVDASRVRLELPPVGHAERIRILSEIENLRIEPGGRATVVVNERTGTVVAGGEVTISEVTISHGNLKVAISTDYYVSQPLFARNAGPGVQAVVVPDTTIEIEEELPTSVSLPDDTTVADLVLALNRVEASSRDIIVILQAIKRAGALHAELLIE
jgi:flagellar P-ring protein precursor FlgI